jgi:hypothetical protein
MISKKDLFIVFGIFFIIEGVGSVLVSPLQVPLFQLGRVVRILIGIYLVYFGFTHYKK